MSDQGESEPGQLKGLRATAEAIFYYVDKEAGKIMVPMVVRGEKYRKRYRDSIGSTEELYGTRSFPGGHLEIEKREAAIEAVMREAGEELVKAGGSKVLGNLDPSLFGRAVHTGINFGRLRDKANWQAGTVWFGYMYPLSSEQYKALEDHVEKMANDPDYADQVRQRTGQEVASVQLVDLKELPHKHREGEKPLIGYDYEIEFAEAVLERLNELNKTRMLEARIRELEKAALRRGSHGSRSRQ